MHAQEAAQDVYFELDKYVSTFHFGYGDESPNVTSKQRTQASELVQKQVFAYFQNLKPDKLPWIFEKIDKGVLERIAEEHAEKLREEEGGNGGGSGSGWDEDILAE